ncbi:MAG: PglL family O-oligosaccharyltransferase [Burkholderiales bacterium]
MSPHKVGNSFFIQPQHVAQLSAVLVIALVVAPWLNPFASGPSAAVTPLLVAWTCAALLVLLWQPAAWQPVALGWLVAGLASTLIALCQFFDLEQVFSPWINQAEPGLAFANLRQRNQFATLTHIAQAALLFGFLSQPLTRTVRGWALVAAAVLAVGSAASSSRTGLLQLALLVMLALGWAWHAQRQARKTKANLQAFKASHLLDLKCLQWSCVVIFFYVLSAWALPRLAGLDPAEHGIFARLSQDLGCSSRRVLWANVLELIGQRPWLGWGWGELDYAHYMHFYSNPQPEQRFCAILDNAHNLPLHLAVELGLPFAVLASAGAVWWVLRQRPWAERKPVRQMAWSVLALVGLHSLLEFPLWYGPFQIAVGLSLALLMATPDSNATPNKAKTFYRHAPVAVIFAMACAVVLTYAAWDYWRVSQIYLPPDERSTSYRENTLAKLRASVLFEGHVQFAELTLTTLSASNASQVYPLAKTVLHFSPEPRVVEKLIESATFLGFDEEALLHLARYRAAHPQEYQAWQTRQKAPAAAPTPAPASNQVASQPIN